MNITFGVTTYNRVHYLQKMLASLNESVDIHRLNIRVYDDMSTEYDAQQLRQWIPTAKDIIIRPEKMYADKNIWQMYWDFLDTGDDVFINADSDLIFRPNWLNMALSILLQTDGVLSLYNSCLHPFITPPPPPKNDSLIQWSSKKSLGSAGTLFTRDIVAKIMRHLGQGEVGAFDWRWSAFLREQNIRLACLHESYVQHIGFQGQNNKGNFAQFDFGLNFQPENAINGAILMDLLFEIKMSLQTKSLDAEELIQTYGSNHLLKAIFMRRWKKYQRSIQKHLKR